MRPMHAASTYSLHIASSIYIPKKSNQTRYYTAVLLRITIPISLDLQFSNNVSWNLLCRVTGCKLQCGIFLKVLL